MIKASHCSCAKDAFGCYYRDLIMQQFALEWIGKYGYIGIFSLLVLGIVGIPIPDEWLLAFSGYLVFKHNLRFTPAVIAAFGGAACGISVSYGCGYTLGSRVIEKYGRAVHITRERLEKIRGWFNRLGRWALILGYFIPGVRHLTACVAGISRMSFRIFALFAYSGALIWSVTFVSVGYLWGEEWSHFSEGIHHALVIGAAATALAGLAGYFAIGAWRRKQHASLIKC